MTGPVYVTSGAGSSTRNDVRDPGDGSLFYSYGLAGFTAASLTWVRSHTERVPLLTHAVVMRIYSLSPVHLSSQDELTLTSYDRFGTVLNVYAQPWAPRPACGLASAVVEDARCGPAPAPPADTSAAAAPAAAPAPTPAAPPFDQYTLAGSVTMSGGAGWDCACAP